MKIVLASHSNLAAGMKETAEFIMGKQKHLYSLTAYLEEGRSLIVDLSELVGQFEEDSVIFLTDLKGGSVNREISEFIVGNDNYYLIAGMNLALVLELLTISYMNQREEVIRQLKEVVTNAANGIEVIEIQESVLQEEEDF